MWRVFVVVAAALAGVLPASGEVWLGGELGAATASGYTGYVDENRPAPYWSIGGGVAAGRLAVECKYATLADVDDVELYGEVGYAMRRENSADEFNGEVEGRWRFFTGSVNLVAGLTAYWARGHQRREYFDWSLREEPYPVFMAKYETYLNYFFAAPLVGAEVERGRFYGRATVGAGYRDHHESGDYVSAGGQFGGGRDDIGARANFLAWSFRAAASYEVVAHLRLGGKLTVRDDINRFNVSYYWWREDPPERTDVAFAVTAAVVL
jgi:hypothetical protein